MTDDPTPRPRPAAPDAPRQIAVYGKGGIGKSTIVSALAVLFAGRGHRVALVGCDPKHDTSYKVASRFPAPTVLGEYEQKREHLRLDDVLIEGRHGITCVEAGGPEPGVGCAGRGISRMFELFDQLGFYDLGFDVVLYDVLGDVVCGGFATPIRKGFANEVLVVASGEVMSLYAANNICRALVRLRANGVRLRGLVGNLRGLEDEEALLTTFALRVGTSLLTCVPRDQAIFDAERERLTVVEHAPDSRAARALRGLVDLLEASSAVSGSVPRPMGDVGFDELLRSAFRRLP